MTAITDSLFVGSRLSFGQVIRSASVLETLLEPPRLSSGPLVSYLTEMGGNASAGSFNRPKSNISISSIPKDNEVSDCQNWYEQFRILLCTPSG